MTIIFYIRQERIAFVLSFFVFSRTVKILLLNRCKHRLR